MVIRPLSQELQAKAIAELNEKPERITDDIQHLKDWLAKQKHIRARTDDQWLLTFLRGCKFSLERTKEKIDMYYTMKTIIPEFFKDRDPYSPKMQEMLKLGAVIPLSTSIGPDQPKVVLIRTGIWDPARFTLEDLFTVNTMITDILLLEDDQYIVAGMCVIQDLTSITMGHFTSIPLSTMKKAFTCWQDGYPNRPKAIHMFNIPSFFEVIYNMFKPFMKEKMQKRMIIHTSGDMEELYKEVPKRVLPTEYGGEAGPIQKEIDFWKKKVESYADWFKEDEAKYGTDEHLRPGKLKTSDEVFGVDGSFRKLNLD